MERNKIYCGNSLDVLKTFPDKVFQCCITSPPFFGLRSYNTGKWIGGSQDCVHDTIPARNGRGGSGPNAKNTTNSYPSEFPSPTCSKCGATYEDFQLGLEATPDEYVTNLVEVFREVKRTLRDDGILFLNLGDSYCGAGYSNHKNTGGVNRTNGRSKHDRSYALNAFPCDTSDRGEPSFPDRDHFSESPCGERINFWWNHISDNTLRLAHEQVALLCQQNLVNKVKLPDHLPIEDFSLRKQIRQSLNASLDRAQTLIPAIEQILSFQESKPNEYVPPLLGELKPKDTLLVFLSLLRSLAVCAREFERKSVGSLETPCDTRDTFSSFEELCDHIRCISRYYSLVSSWLNLPYIQPYNTTNYINISIKPKDLIGIPWLVAFALRDDGWWLRSDIIWAKGVSGQKELTSQIYNAGIEIGIDQNKIEALIENLGLYVGNSMPESVVDRPSKSHEYLFMFTKSKKYFYDGEAVKEGRKNPEDTRPGKSGNYTTGKLSGSARENTPNGQTSRGRLSQYCTSKRNLRSVWTLVTKPFKSAHFATFCEELLLNPIKSSTSEKGCCPACNAPYKRILLKKPMVIRKTDRMAQMGEFGRTQASGTMLSPAESKTVGWQQTCSCILDCAWGDPEPCLILDPFMGSGTVGVVSKKLGRDFVGIDLNADYCKMAEERINSI